MHILCFYLYVKCLIIIFCVILTFKLFSSKTDHEHGVSIDDTGRSGLPSQYRDGAPTSQDYEPVRGQKGLTGTDSGALHGGRGQRRPGAYRDPDVSIAGVPGARGRQYGESEPGQGKKGSPHPYRGSDGTHSAVFGSEAGGGRGPYGRSQGPESQVPSGTQTPSKRGFFGR